MTASSRIPPSEPLDDLLLADLVQDLTERLQRQEPVVLDAVIEQYPQFAERLRRLFPAVQALADLDATIDPGTIDVGVTGIAQSATRAEPEGTIGDFRILREIGRGGMGVVYEARQISLSRRVALKVLPFAAALDARALERFRNESHAAARLDHPHIVHIHGVGCDRGVHYFAMQYIEGRSLAEVIAEMKESDSSISKSQIENRKSKNPGVNTPGSPGKNPKSEIQNPKSTSPDIALGCASRLNAGAETVAGKKAPLSTERHGNRPEFYKGVARLAIQVAEALDYAHSQGVLHRDIKPGNLLLDDLGQVWIADFGLARIGEESSLTRTGDMVGTLRYASPEQLLAQRGLVDQRTDIYSLGATLYEFLTLKPVFHDDDRKQLLKQITDVDPQPLRKVDPSIPQELETIVLKCLEKEPADRYVTARDVAADLKHYLANEPLVVRRAGFSERLIKWSRRHQPWVLAILATTTLATLFLAGSTAWVVHERDQTSRERVTAATQRALATARQSTLHQHAYITSIHRADRARKTGDFAEAVRLLDECRPRPGEEDQRGFEWDLLWSAAQQTPQAWRRHEGECYCARFSPDGTLLATSGQDGVRIWSWPAGEPIAHLTAHTNDVNGVAFSPDGTLLATASDDRSVKIFETKTWTELRTIPHPNGEVVAVVFTPDGKLLLCAERLRGARGENHEVVRVLRVADGTELSRVVLPKEGGPGGHDNIEGIAVSADGRFVAAAGGHLFAGSARVWELDFPPTDNVSPEISIGHTTSVRSVAFAHRRPVWAAADGRGIVALYNTDKGGLENYLMGHTNSVESVSFCPRDDALVSAGRDGTVRLWEFTAAGNQMYNSTTYRGMGHMWCAVFSPDGATIVATGKSGAVMLFHRNRTQECRNYVVPVPGMGNSPIAFTPDGRNLLASWNGLWLIDLDGKKAPENVIPTEDHFGEIVFSPDGKSLVTTRSKSGVEVWDTTTWTRSVNPCDVPERLEWRKTLGLTFLAFRRDGTARLVEALLSQSSRVFDDGREGVDVSQLVAFDGHPGMSFSERGKLMAFVGSESNWYELNVYEASSQSLAFHSDGQFLSVAFSRDGSLLATGGLDGVIRIWNARTWEEPLVAIGHSAVVGHVAFSTDGRTLASAARDGSIKLWHVATGRELVSLEGHSRSASFVRFSPDGRTLASSGVENAAEERHEIHIWRVPPRDAGRRDE